jgi:hypothetical protein
MVRKKNIYFYLLQIYRLRVNYKLAVQIREYFVSYPKTLKNTLDTNSCTKQTSSVRKDTFSYQIINLQNTFHKFTVKIPQSENTITIWFEVSAQKLLHHLHLQKT